MSVIAPALLAAMVDSPSCAASKIPVGPVSRAAGATRVSAAQKQTLPAKAVRQTIAAPSRRLVWVDPTDAEPGVFIFRRRGLAWRYTDAWGGEPTDRGEMVRWAMLNPRMPAGLAACFVDQLLARPVTARAEKSGLGQNIHWSDSRSSHTPHVI